MLVGTIGSFFVFVLEAENGQVPSNQELEYEEYMEQQEQAARERAASAQALEGYEASAFSTPVKELKVDVVKSGDGAVVESSSTIEANYFGWTSDGTIFDSSRRDGTAVPVEFPLSGVIPGWTQGLEGQKVGSVVKLTIPSDMAYGEAGSPPLIGPNEPLQFIVEIVSIVNTEETTE